MPTFPPCWLVWRGREYELASLPGSCDAARYKTDRQGGGGVRQDLVKRGGAATSGRGPLPTAFTKNMEIFVTRADVHAHASKPCARCRIRPDGLPIHALLTARKPTPHPARAPSPGIRRRGIRRPAPTTPYPRSRAGTPGSAAAKNRSDARTWRATPPRVLHNAPRPPYQPAPLPHRARPS